jgi:hypothetical protein
LLAARDQERPPIAYPDPQENRVLEFDHEALACHASEAEPDHQVLAGYASKEKRFVGQPLSALLGSGMDAGNAGRHGN